jgi:hypothetical protein
LREIVIAFHRSLFRSTGFLFHTISVPASLPVGPWELEVAICDLKATASFTGRLRRNRRFNHGLR